MTVDGNESIRSILELRSNIEKVFFKEFEGSLNYPIKLNHTHIKTMMILKFEGEKPMSVISDKLNLEKGSFTPVANNLIELGIIEKIPDYKDKRVFNLRLTDMGNDLSTEIGNKHSTYVNKLFNSLSENEKDLYLAGIHLINSITKKIQDNKSE